MRAFKFSVICLAATCFAQDMTADREPIYQPSHRPIRREIFNALRKEDSKERRTRLEELYAHIERRIERYEERPFLAMAYRLSLLHVLIELDDKRAALEAAREVVASYRDELDPDEFRAWLNCVLFSYRRDGPRERIELLLRAASKRGLSKEDILSGVQAIDRDDWDRDGVPNGQDKCRCFDDRRDSDRDGIPDACDMCWGRPDKPDSDEDGTPDACDLCPGKTDLDRDFDNVPDGCDSLTRSYNPMEPRRKHVPKYRPDCECIDPPYPACCHQPGSGRVWITRVEDSAGRLLESYEYTDFGEISKKTMWDGAETPLYTTTYVFNENEQVISYTESCPNGKTPPRTTKVFRDEEGQSIGFRKEGEDPSKFHYYNKNMRRILSRLPPTPPKRQES